MLRFLLLFLVQRGLGQRLEILRATRAERRILVADEVLEYIELDLHFSAPVYVTACGAPLSAVHVSEALRCASCPPGCTLSAAFSRFPYVPDLLPKLQSEPECICGVSYEEMQLRTQAWPGDQGFDVLTNRRPAFIHGIPQHQEIYASAIWKFDALLANIKCPNEANMTPALARIRRFGINGPPLDNSLMWFRRVETAFGVEEIDRLLANASKSYNSRRAIFLLPTKRTKNGRTRTLGLSLEELAPCRLDLPFLTGPHGEPADSVLSIGALKEKHFSCKSHEIEAAHRQMKSVMDRVLTAGRQEGHCTSDWRTTFPARGSGGPGGTAGKEYVWGVDPSNQTTYSPYTVEMPTQRFRKVGILHGKPANGKGRWHILRSFIQLKRRIQGNAYNLNDAIRMRMNCKEYIRLYKKKFNGPQSSFHWRRSLPPLTAEDATRLGLIELSYPADKLVNFRMMAQTEMKTETSINSFSEEGSLGEMKRSPRSQVWQVRELTPMEQLHLHGQHGFGTNIFRGLPPPPSNLKVRIDIVAPLGLWWVCKLGTAAETGSWAVALDSGTQPVRLLLVDSISDNSVFATLEVPRGVSQSVSLLLARTEAAFEKGAPPSAEVRGVRGGGSGVEEWCSMIEFDGDICCWAQVKTVPMTASHSPWDLFGSFTCGRSSSKSREERSFGRVTPLDELIAERFPRMRRPTSEKGASASSPSLRMNLPLRMPGGQEGPFVALLRWCLSTSVSQSSPQSILACLAALVRSGYALAALRLHVSLPPVFLQGVESARVFSDVPLRLPPFDAACHFENGGLVDGFVVGLHNLYNFANLVAAMPDVKRPKAANSVPTSNARRQMTNVTPLSLQPLEQAPPLLLTLGAFLAASAIVLAGGRRPASNSENLGEGDELTKMAEKHGLLGVVKAAGSDPKAGITLIPTLLAVVLGRRALYERLRAEPSSCTEDPQEVFQFFAATLHVLLAMGFPLHRCALPLAAWVGSVELVQVLSRRCNDFAGNNVPGGALQMLISWAARGIYCNPCTSAQVEVLKWLMHRKADPSLMDSTGRSVLDWTCWAGCDEFASVLLRRSFTRPVDVQMPLLLATASRSLRLVKILLDVSGDPHSGPSGDAGSASCGALTLAVRCSEFELASQILQSAAFVNVDVALADGRRSSMPRFAGDEDKGAGAATRATILLVESFRRFASGLQRLSVEEVSVAGLRQHVPGAHPDENLYATSIMPLGDVLHPLAAQLTSPMHWVPLDLRPGCTPMQWIKRGLNPWTPARLMVECLLQRGFKPDEAFLSKVNLALPPEVQSLTRRLAGETGGPAPCPLPTLLAEIIPKDTRRKIPKLTLKEMYHMQGVPVNGQSKLTSVNGQDFLEEKSVNEERESPIPKTTEYLKVSRAEVGRPAIRVVVLGAPRVGKSSVTKILAEYLDMTYAVEDEGPTRFRVVRGSWPTARPPIVEVLLWDTVTPTLPELVTEKNCAVVAVAVVDAEDERREAESMAMLCLSNESFTAPRRALVVENSRSGDDIPRPSANTELEGVRCNILQEEGRVMLKKVFGRLIAEMVGQIEARQEVTTTEELISPDTPCGEGDFRQVLTRHRNLPGLGLRKPLGCRSHAYRLRGTSALVDPTALSLAWRALQAARSTLQAEVQSLTGSSPPGPSGLVTNEAVNATLALAEAGSTGQQLSATLRRALMELNLMCPVTSEGKGEMVLIPDFAEKMALSPSVLQQLTDTTRTNGTGTGSRVVFVRLQFSRRCGRVPSLRRVLGHFLASKSVPTLRYFAQLEELGHFGTREASSVRDLSDLSGFVLALEGDEKSSTFSELAGIGELVACQSMTLVMVMVQGDHWDVLCRGPRATWAWRLFMSHLPSFARLSTTVERSTDDDAETPRHTLHGGETTPQQSVTTTTEDLSNVAWLFTGPQSRSLRERLILNTKRTGCFGSFCSSKFSRFGSLEDPAEEFEVRLLLRSWREIPHLLSRVLQRGHHSIWICTTALHRFAQNFDTLSDADALPMLRLQDQEVQSFDPHDEGPETTTCSLEVSEVTMAVQSWMVLCSPLALWCRHRTTPPEKLEDLARQVAKALQRAAGNSTPFSEQLNLELRETLRLKASAFYPEVTEI